MEYQYSSKDEYPKQTVEHGDRQLASKNILCNVIHNEVMFEPDMYGDIALGDFYACNPVSDNGYISSESFTLDLPDRILKEYGYRLEEGFSLYVEIPDATLTSDSVLVHSEDQMRVVEPPSNLQHRRRLNRPSTIGSLDVIVIRITANDSEPSYSAHDLYNIMFDDGISMRSQFRMCSNGNLDIRPTVHGVMNVKVNLSVSENSHGAFVNAATVAADALLPSGSRSVRDVADLVLFVVPPGTGSFAAYATVNGVQVSLPRFQCN